MKQEAEKHLEIALGGNMNISTLTPLALIEIMTDFAKKQVEAINDTHCSEQLESKEGNDFWYWCAVNKYARIDNNTFKKGNETIYREELYKYWRSKINKQESHN